MGEEEIMHVVTEDRIIANTSPFNSLSLYKHQQTSENSELNYLILIDCLTLFAICQKQATHNRIKTTYLSGINEVEFQELQMF